MQSKDLPCERNVTYVPPLRVYILRSGLLCTSGLLICLLDSTLASLLQRGT